MSTEHRAHGTWIVTGASRGLGAALVREFCAGGSRVLACARDEVALTTLAADFEPGQVIPCVLDLADAASIAPRLERTLAGLGPIDGLINNAGIGFYKPFLDHSSIELANIVQVNLLAVMQLCQLVLPRLLQQGRGHIVNIGSDLGRRPLAKMAPYVASKHGLTGFSHSLLREVKASGVRVSLVNPGMIDTGFGGGPAGQQDESDHLKPQALARLIVDLTRQPGHLLIDELSVHPLGQAEF